MPHPPVETKRKQESSQNSSINYHCLYLTLYHAKENTANQNAVKLLYFRRYSTKPSHRALHLWKLGSVLSLLGVKVKFKQHAKHLAVTTDESSFQPSNS